MSYKRRGELRVWTDEPVFVVIGSVLLTGMAVVFLIVGLSMTDTYLHVTARCGREVMQPGEVCVYTSGPAPTAVNPSVGDSFAEVVAEQRRLDEHVASSFRKTYLFLAGVALVGDLIWISLFVRKRRRRRRAQLPVW